MQKKMQGESKEKWFAKDCNGIVDAFIASQQETPSSDTAKKLWDALQEFLDSTQLTKDWVLEV